MRAAIISVLILAIPLAAVGGWYLARTSSDQAEADRFVDWTRQQKMVPVKFVVTAPANTKEGQILYICGSAPTLGAWQEDAGVPMTKGPDGKWTATVEVMSGLEHAFKVNRGTWSTVEIDKDDKDIPDRKFVADKENTVVTADVIDWRDHGNTVPGRITLTGEVRQHAKFHSDLLAIDHTLRVYLPPGYSDEANEARRYPVLYMHDGQNLFDEKSSFAGIEWKVDEAAQKLIESGKIEPIIIVGIYNGGEYRTSEFTPGPLASGSEPAQGENYCKFVAEQVKPFIDQQYRTMPDTQHTAIAGSSLGGLITLAIVKAYPDTFGRVAVLTPWLQLNGKPITAAIGEDLSFLKGRKLWIDMGDKPGANYPKGADPIKDAQAFAAKLQASGLESGRDFTYTEIPGGTHDETAWQGRIEQVLVHLFGK